MDDIPNRQDAVSRSQWLVTSGTTGLLRRTARIGPLLFITYTGDVSSVKLDQHADNCQL